MITNNALVFVDKGQAEIKQVPLPEIRDDYIIVKVNAVGLNPTDWKHIDGGRTVPGSKIGCDYAGVVQQVGSAVTKDFQKGDRVCGVVHGGNSSQPEDGGFTHYLVAKGDLQIKTPDNISDEEAATLGISVCTVAQGLYQTLGLSLPGEKTGEPSEYVLINGGSTATGIYGIQYAKLSGYKVIATSSPHNFSYLESLGADKVFDYKSPTVGADIRAYTDNKLKVAWDCTGNAGAISAEALSSEGGKLATIIPVDKKEVEPINPKVDGPHFTLMYTIFNEEFHKFETTYPASPHDFEFGKKFWEITRGLLAEGKLQAPKIILNKGGKGLEGIPTGLDELRNGRVSAGKLVYTL